MSRQTRTEILIAFMLTKSFKPDDPSERVRFIEGPGMRCAVVVDLAGYPRAIACVPVATQAEEARLP